MSCAITDDVADRQFNTFEQRRLGRVAVAFSTRTTEYSVVDLCASIHCMKQILNWRNTVLLSFRMCHCSLVKITRFWKNSLLKFLTRGSSWIRWSAVLPCTQIPAEPHFQILDTPLTGLELMQRYTTHVSCGRCVMTRSEQVVYTFVSLQSPSGIIWSEGGDV